MLLGWAILWLGCGGPTANASSHTLASANPQKNEDGVLSGRKPVRKRKPDEGKAAVDTGMLKGKGGTVEVVSRKATAQKMADWDVTAEKVLEVAPLVEEAAEVNGLPAALIFGVIWVESRFNPEAVSPVGARGLMQLMPKTAKYLAECMGWEGSVDSFDPAFNIAAGSYYIARLIRQFDGDVDLALAAYNAGPANIRRWMNNTGLPKVSIEYYTMVQTARQYFPDNSKPEGPGEQLTLPSDDDLDRLGLAILIAGLSRPEFGLERPDDANPFDEM